MSWTYATLLALLTVLLALSWSPEAESAAVPGSTGSAKDPQAEQKQILAANERKRQFHEEKRNEFESSEEDNDGLYESGKGGSGGCRAEPTLLKFLPWLAETDGRLRDEQKLGDNVEAWDGGFPPVSKLCGLPAHLPRNLASFSPSVDDRDGGGPRARRLGLRGRFLERSRGGVGVLIRPGGAVQRWDRGSEPWRQMTVGGHFLHDKCVSLASCVILRLDHTTITQRASSPTYPGVPQAVAITSPVPSIFDKPNAFLGMHLIATIFPVAFSRAITTSENAPLQEREGGREGEKERREGREKQAPPSSMHPQKGVM
ncbi:putative cartilage matrix-associated protein [Liparis tanakae]|uniref:Putative cartilage matrix-associated protein n=1 Tax=Liparis tanakae TaxID=230148 RepID=A0A4Z2IVX3_9TELE|nr:putative cartilage matrix-associated protein [Liparis tanakae]